MSNMRLSDGFEDKAANALDQRRIRFLAAALLIDHGSAIGILVDHTRLYLRLSLTWDQG